MDPRPEGASDSRIDLLCCSVNIHLKGTWETQNHQILCMRLVLVSIIIETLHDQSFSLTSEDIASETPNHQLLGTRAGDNHGHDVLVR